MSAKKVQPKAEIQPLLKFNPDPDWEKTSEQYGSLKTKDGEDLVRLHQIVVWLLPKKNRLLKDAVESIGDVFREHGLAHVYRLHKKTSPTSMLNPTPSKIQEIRSEEERLAGVLANFDLLVSKESDLFDGLRDLSKLLQRLDWYGRNTRSLAITWPAANHMFGWGAVAEPENWPQLVGYRRAFPRTDWTQNMCDILQEEVFRRDLIPGSKKVKEAVGEELGITRQRIGELIPKAEEPGKREAARNARIENFQKKKAAAS